jgi:hypothetical protein
MIDADQRKPRLLSTGASSSAHHKVVTRLRDHSPRRSHCIPKHKSPHRLSKKCWSLSKPLAIIGLRPWDPRRSGLSFELCA